MAFPSHTWETSICGLRVCPNSCSNKNYFACAALLQQPLGPRLQEAEWGFPRSLWRISVTQWQLITPSISKPERLSCEQNRRQRLVMCFGFLGSNWDTTSCFQGLSMLPLKSWTWGTAQLLKNGQQAYSLLIIDLHTDRLCDTRNFKRDKVILSLRQGCISVRTCWSFSLCSSRLFVSFK